MSLGNTFYHDLLGRQSHSEALGDRRALWPTPEQMGPGQPSSQHPIPHQPSSCPAGGGVGQMGVPVPLYSVPEVCLPGTGGCMAVTGPPGGEAWEETQQIYPPPGKTCWPGWKPGVRSVEGEEADDGSGRGQRWGES